MCLMAAALRYSARPISRPVESPWACSTRLRLCAPSRVKAILRSRAIELACPTRSALRCAAGLLPPDTRRPLRCTSPSPAFKRVFQVQADFIFVAERGGDSALGILRVRLGDFALGEAEDAAGGRKFHRSAETGDARAYDDEIGLRGKLLNVQSVSQLRTLLICMVPRVQAARCRQYRGAFMRTCENDKQDVSEQVAYISVTLET